jgi:hypothetical protein
MYRERLADPFEISGGVNQSAYFKDLPAVRAEINIAFPMMADAGQCIGDELADEDITITISVSSMGCASGSNQIV